ncbi:MAG: M14-type cytosolic carboxypeptidase [Myxococcota bacterium]
MRIAHRFEGGAIRVLDARRCDDVVLALQGDNAADFKQWFSFKVLDARGERCRFRIIDAGKATFAHAFDGYRACASVDGEHWWRVRTRFDGETLTILDRPRANAVHYAYFAPYPAKRRRSLLRACADAPLAGVRTLARSTAGRPVDVVEAGAGPRQVWLIARQHPGETMAEWFMEGLLGRLLFADDPISDELLARATFHIVTCMNPDGGALGNHRTNAAGCDLNRAWMEPGDDAPEVLGVREAMEETGVDLFLDVHGDERTNFVFAAGCEGNPGYDERLANLEELFLDALANLDPDFQTERGYPLDAPGDGDLTTAANFIGEAFDCLSLTLEMPFRDPEATAHTVEGWSPPRAMRFGANVLEAILTGLDALE